MKTLNIINKKNFTKQLFIEETFDNFLMTECCFVTNIKTEIDGHLINPVDDEFITWKQVKSIAYNVIKGKELPRSFKIVLKLSNSNTDQTTERLSLSMDDRPGLFINILYENEELKIITGTFTRSFLSGKELESGWQDFVMKFLSKNLIDYEEE